MLWSRATLKLPRPSLTSSAAQAVASPTPPRHSTGTRSSIHKFVNTPRIVKVHRKEAVATLTSLSQAVNTEIRRSWDTAFVDYSSTSSRCAARLHAAVNGGCEQRNPDRLLTLHDDLLLHLLLLVLLHL